MAFLKKYWIWIAIIILIIVILVVWRRRSQANKVQYRGSWPMGYISARDHGAHAVHLNNRPPAGTIVQGDTVVITGTPFDGTYSVTDVWNTAGDRGNVGALYLRIPYEPTGENDTAYVNKGTINLI